MNPADDRAAEDALRDELAQGDALLETIGPVLGHLLANQDHTLFSDEILSRVRGMVSDIARQLLIAQAEAAGAEDPPDFAERERSDLTGRLLTEAPLIEHCHARALEWQLTAKIEARDGIDPVLTPLLQALIASDDAAVASVAMAALAAQARYVQNQRRMELPLDQLPADLFHTVLSTWPSQGGGNDAGIAEAVTTLRAGFDESASRTGLLARLVESMGAGAIAALSLAHGGVALFLTALAALSRQDRDAAILATTERQLARLALSLRAAGLKPRDAEEQFVLIHPDANLPDGLGALRADRAASLIGSSTLATAI